MAEQELLSLDEVSADEAYVPVLEEGAGDRIVVEDGAARLSSARPRWSRASAVKLTALGLFAAAAVVAAVLQRAGPQSAGTQLLAGDTTELTLVASEDARPKPAGGKERCKTAVKGDACYKSVVWAMTEGIRTHPKWYPGLSKTSLFEKFQENLHTFNKKKCPKPCASPKNCRTAVSGECLDSVTWSMTVGVDKHPKWFRGLTKDSPFESFQANIHKSNKTRCPVPCNPQPFKAVTLFCWSVVRPVEVPLMKMQLEKRGGIFGCDNYAVVSDKPLQLGDGPHGPVKVLHIGSTSVSGYTGDGTSPNAPIFVNAWDQIRADGRFSAYDFTVKCDPDTVLLADRLALKLAPGGIPANPYPPPYASPSSKGVFVTNCDKMANWGAGWGNGWPMMYGSVEIISRQALLTYFGGVAGCKGSMPWMGMGEDAFMGLCLRKLKVGEWFLKQGDGACAGGACTDGSFAAYHPFKDPGMWADCWGKAHR